VKAERTGISEDSISFVVSVALACTVLAVYFRVGGHSFLYYDDEQYLAGNDIVRRGLTGEGISWAFSAFHAANWHPLTWLSHMLDVSLFGMDAGWHHRVNVLFHGMNSLMLFLSLRKMTGALWQSGAVAALFAVHPLHVESVAWVSERKDLLSAFFLMLTMNAYVAYVRRPGFARYLPVAGFLALGLLSKPMLVTLPFVLLLLDYWPLGRFSSEGSGPTGVPVPPATVSPHRLILEKLPLLSLSAASCVVTFMAQKSGNAMVPMEYVPLAVRIENATFSYLKYLGKTVWPSSLSVVYPHPATLRGMAYWEVALAAGVLFLVTGWVVLQGRRRPYLAVGWLWYLGTLVPVIGLVQVGVQSMADRYTYIPLIGVFISAVWGISGILPREAFPRNMVPLAAVGMIAVLGWLSWRQAGLWKNDIVLFSHALQAYPENQEARFNLGVAYNNRGMSLLSQGNAAGAAAHFREALKMSPLDVTVLLNLGVAEASSGDFDEAIRSFRKVTEVRPDDERARRNLEQALRLKEQRERGGTGR